MPVSNPAGRRISAGGIEFNVLDEGSGPPVVLFHGFPDRADMWRDVAALLREGGRRTVAIDLPGFGESAAPKGRANYRADRVLGQVAELLPALGLNDPVDLIGHDWGAYLSWYAVLTRPGLVRRHVALSVGHPRAFLRAGPGQMWKSRYMLLFVVPWVSERVLSAGGFRAVRDSMGESHPDIETVIRDLSRPGRLTAGLSWYRANFFRTPLQRWARCRVPTLGVFPTEDDYLGERQMVNSELYMDAPWRYERLEGLGHWAPLQAPERVAGPALDWLGT